MPYPIIANPTGITYDNGIVYVAVSYNSVQSLIKIPNSGNDSGIITDIIDLAGSVPKGIVYVSTGTAGIYICESSQSLILFVNSSTNNITTFANVSSYGIPNCITTDTINLYIGTVNGKVLQIPISDGSLITEIVTTGLQTVTGISFNNYNIVNDNISNTSNRYNIVVSDASGASIYAIDLRESAPITPILVKSGISNLKDVQNDDMRIIGGAISRNIVYNTNTAIYDIFYNSGTATVTTVATNPYPAGLSYMTRIWENTTYYISDINNAIRTVISGAEVITNYYANPYMTLPTGIAADYQNPSAFNDFFLTVAALNNGVQSLFSFDITGTITQILKLTSYSINGITKVNSGLEYLCDSIGKQIIRGGQGNIWIQVANLTSFGTPKCITNDGTDLYVGCTNGTIVKITISTGDVTTIVASGGLITNATGISYNNDILLVADPTSVGYVYAIDLTLTNGPILVHSHVGAIKDIIGFDVAITYNPTVITGSAIYCRQTTMVKTSLSVKSLRYFTYNTLEGLGYISHGVNESGPFYFTDTSGNTIYKIPTIANGTTTPYTIYNFATGAIGNGGGSAPCFLQGSTILCYIDGNDVYIPIEQIIPGTLVKTRLNGYKQVIIIGNRPFKNTGTDITDHLEQRLYKLSTTAYSELTEDLYLTGGHSILVGSMTDEQEKKTIKHLGEVFITENRYRLLACIDERAEAWDSQEEHIIWHFALEHTVVNANYGVYANGGLLVESSSINYMKNKSNMVLDTLVTRFHLAPPSLLLMCSSPT